MQARRLLLPTPARQRVTEEAAREAEAPNEGVLLVNSALACYANQDSVYTFLTYDPFSCLCLVKISSMHVFFGVADVAKAVVEPATAGKWTDPLKKSAAFGQLQKLMEERIIYIDGAMGTSIQKHK